MCAFSQSSSLCIFNCKCKCKCYGDTNNDIELTTKYKLLQEEPVIEQNNFYSICNKRNRNIYNIIYQEYKLFILK